jgi:hypothetical protein
MRKPSKRFAVALVALAALDLLVAGVLLLVVGRGVSATLGPRQAPKMGARQLERLLTEAPPRSMSKKAARDRVRFDCVRDSRGGWDYVCTGSWGGLWLYSVDGKKITRAMALSLA